jgi:hypothetical protein
MQVAKLRIANDNGLLPAGGHFFRLAAAMREADERAAAVLDIYEEYERKRKSRSRGKAASPVSTKALTRAPRSAGPRARSN